MEEPAGNEKRPKGEKRMRTILKVTFGGRVSYAPEGCIIIEDPSQGAVFATSCQLLYTHKLCRGINIPEFFPKRSILKY